jgi:hypothetical protein
MLYDKKNDTVRTIRVNTLFREIAVQARVLSETKNDNPFWIVILEVMSGRLPGVRTFWKM